MTSVFLPDVIAHIQNQDPMGIEAVGPGVPDKSVLYSEFRGILPTGA